MIRPSDVLKGFLLLDSVPIPRPKQWATNADMKAAALAWPVLLGDISPADFERGIVAFIREPTGKTKWWPQPHEVLALVAPDVGGLTGDDAWGHLLALYREHGRTAVPVEPGAPVPWRWHVNAMEDNACRTAVEAVGGYEAFCGDCDRVGWLDTFGAVIESAERRAEAYAKLGRDGGWHTVADAGRSLDRCLALAATNGPEHAPSKPGDIGGFHLADDPRIEVAMWRALRSIGSWRGLRDMPDDASQQAATRATFRRVFDVAMSRPDSSGGMVRIGSMLGGTLGKLRLLSRRTGEEAPAGQGVDVGTIELGGAQ